jgi:glycosyltransferase involved in cell wall biosynthesis
MLRCTYIILIKDNQENIPRLIDSLKKTNGNFRKEFIIIDDGSQDNSLNVIKQITNDLPRTTIITQKTLGPSISINKALSLATGDYIQFVEGDEITHSASTESLIEACQKLEVDVAFGEVHDNKKNINDLEVASSKNYMLIQEPLIRVLSNDFPEIRNIGKSGSLIAHELLEKIDKVDNGIYTHNVSLSLSSSVHSSFAFVENVVAIKTNEIKYKDSKFESYNTIKSIYNFAKSHPEICENLIPLLLKSLGKEMMGKSLKVNYFLKFLLSKYFKSVSLDQVLKFYRVELDKLF